VVVGRSPPQAEPLPPLPPPDGHEPEPPPPEEDTTTLVPEEEIPPPPNMTQPVLTPSQQGCAPFDRGAAAQALSSINVVSCRKAGVTRGAGHLKVVYDPSGRVATAIIDSPPFVGTPAGACIAALYRRARIPPFCGGPVTVGKSFQMP
jgi:hypothetical protein